ncbi:lipid-transfer protein [Novosphingobium sp. KCTC 2891]|uniref:lipid-transfer protein n=1 Tax=Novosphingobium sp. KCTC 2891 TaxID=2989730 RepID=UPI0022213D94|nr:lipid-transfer protein [Novosphingobium sp. KCTC 2891]MCW1385023.1 lipid-transfer protein [Novosphingobium sp. KCTC 2891]
MTSFSNKTAIAGYGATEFSKNSGRSELRLAVEATLSALDDAGIDPSEVDGISTYTMDNNGEQEVFRAIGGKDLKFFSRIAQGGGATCAPLQQAALAITCGVADVVVVYRAMNERSEYRFGQPMHSLPPTSDNVVFAYHGLSGLMTPAAMVGMMMRRYMHETGATELDFANYAVLARKNASTNPNAFFYGKPITVEDHQASKMIADPLRLLDCCQESDGAVAVVVVSAERAKDLKQKPVYIRAAAQGSPAGALGLTGFYRENIWPYEECAAAARQLYAQSGLSPKDLDAAIIYDHFGPSVFPGLEAYGFCAKGEAKDFVRDGNLEIGGALPINMHGGQLGEAYIHGMNGVAEAVRQLRGTAVNQVPGVRNMLVTAGSGVPTSAAILGVD